MRLKWPLPSALKNANTSSSTRKEMARLPACGGKTSRAALKNASPISAMSEVPICEFGSASIAAKRAFERRKEELAFLLGGFARADNAGDAMPVCVDNRDDDGMTEEAEADFADLTRFTFVNPAEDGAFEDASGLREADTVFFEVCFDFGIVPLECLRCPTMYIQSYIFVSWASGPGRLLKKSRGSRRRRIFVRCKAPIRRARARRAWRAAAPRDMICA